MQIKQSSTCFDSFLPDGFKKSTADTKTTRILNHEKVVEVAAVRWPHEAWVE